MKANVFSTTLEDGTVEVTTTVTDPPTVGRGQTQRLACDDLIQKLRDSNPFGRITLQEADTV